MCVRLGAQMLTLEAQSLEDHVGPNQFAEAILVATAGAVRVALNDRAEQPDGWQAPWCVLTAVARVVPYPLSERAGDAVEELRRAPAGQGLPALPGGPSLKSPVLWTRDAYGSRFGVTASFSAPGGPDRWYLWDIDACGYQPFTVYSAYFPGPDQALAAWQSGVGRFAAAETTFAHVDNVWLMSELLPAEEGFLRAGGEDAHQLAEYHRSKRLADEVREAVGPGQPARQRKELDVAQATGHFTAWLAENRPGTPQASNLDELIEELAQSWPISGPAALYHTCSPHRVAATALHPRLLPGRLRRRVAGVATRLDILPHRIQRHCAASG